MNKNRPQIRMEELKQDPATAELGGWVGEGPQNSSICIGVHGQVPRDHGRLRGGGLPSRNFNSGARTA